MKIVKEDKYNSIIAKIDKPTLILFTTINCPHCRSMENLLNKLSDDNFIGLKITSDSKRLIKNYEIRAFPTILTFDKYKRPKERLFGLKSIDTLKESINIILK